MAIPPGAFLTGFVKHESGTGVTFQFVGPTGVFTYTAGVTHGATLFMGYGFLERGYSGPITSLFSAGADFSEFAVGWYLGIDQDNPLVAPPVSAALASTTTPSVGPIDNSISSAEALYVWAFGGFGTVTYSSPTCGGETAQIAIQNTQPLGVMDHIARSPASRSGAATTGSQEFGAWIGAFRAAKPARPITARRRTAVAAGGVVIEPPFRVSNLAPVLAQ